MQTFLEKIESFIGQRNLLDINKRYLTALSGGSDSVCLLCVLKEMGYDVEAAHCNFHLRGEESDRDENFCRALCEKMGVKLHVAQFDTIAYAKERKISTEMAARELRYNFFDQLINDYGFAGICVAHHQNDSIETFLINLIRGTGIEGLKGIAPRSGNVLRPLLAVKKQEIEDYMASIYQDYKVDSTNLIPEVLRNKIRLRIIPLLKEINTAAEDNIFSASRYVEGSLKILKTALEEAKKRVVSKTETGVSISVEKLLQEESPEIVLWEVLKEYGFTSMQAEQIYARISTEKRIGERQEWMATAIPMPSKFMKTGKQWLSPTHSLLINREQVLIEPLETKEQEPLVINGEGTFAYNNIAEFSFKIVERINSFQILKESNRVSLDADKVAFPLTIRSARNGDSFVPYGINGSKLLSDYMTDKKISLFDKRRQLVVTDCNGRIIWLVGLRADNRFCITEDTKRALIISRSTLA